MDRPTRDRSGFTLIELLVVIAIISVLVALLLPAVQSVREASNRARCGNNLMQLGLALKNYETAHEVLPPGVVNPAGPIANRPKGYHVGWVVQVLPYLEQKNVFDHLNLDLGVYDPGNTTTRDTVLSVLLCPSDTNGLVSPATSSYAACHHDVEAPIAASNTGVFYLNSATRYEDIEDGASNTVFVGEKIYRSGPDLGWASGTRATLRNTGTPLNTPVAPTATNKDPVGGFSSRHPGGAYFTFGDGSVRFVRVGMAPSVYRRLANRSDGQILNAGQF